jgi:DNA polymerase III subunit alpha
MRMAQVVAGFSLGQADILRRAMGKKKPEEMLKMKELFLAGARARGYDAKTGERIFELLFAFAGYGFNKSHAAAYTIPAYHTIWLKANHPAEFIAANCTNDMSDTDRLSQLIREARDMGLTVLPPDVNLSQKEFTVEGGKIVFGLLGIKNVGSGAVDVIIAERGRGGPFTSALDFFGRVDTREVNRKVVESLVITGAFDRLGETRATLLHNLDKMIEVSARSREAARYGQVSLFEGSGEAPAPLVELERLPELPAAELLQEERRHLGFFFSGHPLDPWRETMDRVVTVDLSRKETLSNDRSCALVGILSEVREIRTRNGRTMAFAQLSDLHGSIECILFSDIYESRRPMIANEAIVGVRGKIDTTRGDAKVKVDDITDPGALPQKAAAAVHIRLKEDVGTEESLHTLREYLLDRRGGCALFFHVGGGGSTSGSQPVSGSNGKDAAGRLGASAVGGEAVVLASSQIRVSGSDDVLDALREYPQVADVWTE